MDVTFFDHAQSKSRLASIVLVPEMQIVRKREIDLEPSTGK